MSLQHDTGRWCTEYTWSADDNMLGARVLHNFGKLAREDPEGRTRQRVKRVDEEDAMEGGLKGRISAGAEVYFSAQEKSGGGEEKIPHMHTQLTYLVSVSTGVRFTTLPDATPPSFQVPGQANPGPSSLTQPPTTITATYNPIMGHISTAYASRVSPDLSLCSRYYETYNPSRN